MYATCRRIALALAGTGMVLTSTGLAAQAAIGERTVRLCSSTGIVFMPFDDGEEERPAAPSHLACHALCQSERRKPKAGARKR